MLLITTRFTEKLESKIKSCLIKPAVYRMMRLAISLPLTMSLAKATRASCKILFNQIFPHSPIFGGCNRALGRWNVIPTKFRCSAFFFLTVFAAVMIAACAGSQVSKSTFSADNQASIQRGGFALLEQINLSAAICQPNSLASDMQSIALMIRAFGEEFLNMQTNHFHRLFCQSTYIPETISDLAQIVPKQTI